MSLLYTNDVAAHFGVSPELVRLWVREGRLHPERNERRWYVYSAEEVEAFQRPTRTPAREGCEAPGCDRPHHSLGHCKPHYQRLTRTGSVNAERPITRVWFGQYNRAPRPPQTFDLDDTDEL